jgi:hypothetical protein
MRTGLCVVYSLSIYLNLLDCPIYSLGLDRLNVPCMLKDHKSCIKRNKKWQSYFRVTVDKLKLSYVQTPNSSLHTMLFTICLHATPPHSY